jgi:hypothetical protein
VSAAWQLQPLRVRAAVLLVSAAIALAEHKHVIALKYMLSCGLFVSLHFAAPFAYNVQQQIQELGMC